MNELFGNHIWSWFNTNTKDTIVGYKWDPKEGVLSNDEEVLENLLSWTEKDDIFEDLNEDDIANNLNKKEKIVLIPQKKGSM